MARPLTLSEPWYVLLFRAHPGAPPYRPVVGLEETLRQYLKGEVTLPLGFDKALAPVIPALWYCLHLPHSRFGFRKIPARVLKFYQRLHSPHRIILLPVPWRRPLPPLLRHADPKILLAPSDLLPEAQALAAGLTSVVDVHSVGDLSSGTLVRHWEMLRSALKVGAIRYVRPSRLFPDNPLRASFLSMLWFVRQLRDGTDRGVPWRLPSQEEVLSYSMYCQAVLSAVARLEAKRTPPPEASRKMPAVLREEMRQFKCPVAVSMPGLAPRASASELTRALRRVVTPPHEDALVEGSVQAFLAAHRAISRGGIAFLGTAVPGDAFVALDELERAWSSPSPRPVAVRRLLGRVGAIAQAQLTEHQMAAILHSNSLTVFTEFPIGLSLAPGGSSPLCCRVPIAYRPLLPLTRALQLELLPVPTIFLRGKLRVLILECIPRTDAAGRASRDGWHVAQGVLRKTQGVTSRVLEVSSAKDVRRALARWGADILVLSAHGIADDQRTGLLLGRDEVFDPEIGRLPPVVFLSACRVSPRGRGTVTVADLLLRQGALVVIGTMIPVDARRNALLMARFFANASEAVRGALPDNSLEAVWHFTRVSNAVNDIVSGNKHLFRWANEGSSGRSVITEFMLHRSHGRLRWSSIYEDSEAILAEIAREQGVERKFIGWLRSPGYTPESLAYIVMGWPDRVVFYDPDFERAERRLGPRVEAWRRLADREIAKGHPRGATKRST